MAWSHPPRPVEVIPSFQPGKESAEHLALYDFLHDADLRDYTGDGDVQKALGVQHQEDIDPLTLIQKYDAGSLPKMDKLKDRLAKAVAHRKKLGALPSASYAADPVVIYYYDTDKLKKITYPKAAVKSDKGFALDPGNIYWWRGNGVMTQEKHDDGTWGDEGFDWDKDVAGNVGTIVGTICSVVGAVLEVFPGIGTAIGTALVILGPIIGAALSVVDAAFQQGDVGKALSNLGQAIVNLAGSKAGMSQAGISIPPEALKTLGQGITSLSGLIDTAQKQGKSFEDSWNTIVADSSSYVAVDDKEIDAIGKSLASDPASKLLHAGYDASHYADLKTLGAIGQLFPDPGAAHLFMFGAGLGALAQAQKAPTKQKQKALVAHSLGLGAHAPIGAATAKDHLLAYVQDKK